VTADGSSRTSLDGYLIMRLGTLVLGAAATTLGCSRAVHSHAQEHAAEVREAQHEGVSFTYSTSDFAKPEIRKEEKQTAQDIGDGVDEGLAPSHFCFNLKDKRPLPALEQGPRYFFPAYSFICVIPLADSSVADFEEAYPSLSDAAVNLQTILRERPDSLQGSEDVPDIPLNNAGHSIFSRFQYLDFRSGSGILFLTQYSQEIEPNPVNNEELTLVFQGMTNDGAHYLAARLAITHPSLPKGIDFTGDIERDRQYRYLSRGAKELEEFSEESFQPSLKSLKALLSSIHVEQ